MCVLSPKGPTAWRCTVLKSALHEPQETGNTTQGAPLQVQGFTDEGEQVGAVLGQSGGGGFAGEGGE